MLLEKLSFRADLAAGVVDAAAAGSVPGWSGVVEGASSDLEMMGRRMVRELEMFLAEALAWGTGETRWASPAAKRFAEVVVPSKGDEVDCGGERGGEVASC